MKTKTIGYTWNKVKLTWNKDEQIWTMTRKEFDGLMGDCYYETTLDTEKITLENVENVVKFILCQYFDIEVV